MLRATRSIYLIIGFLLVSILPIELLCQNPIMFVTCKRASSSFMQQQENDISIKNNNKKVAAVKQLKNLGDACIIGSLPCPPGFTCFVDYTMGFASGICVLACDGAGNCPDGFECVTDPYGFSGTYCAPVPPECLECSAVDGGFLLWNHVFEEFICGDPLIEGAEFDKPFLNGDCDCENGLIKIPNADGTFNCAYPICFDTNISSQFECDGSGEVTVTLTPLDIAGDPITLPPNAVITIDNLLNCEFSDPDAATLYTEATAAGNSVALNTLVFTVTLSGPGGASLSLPDLGVNIEIPAMNCPVVSIEDPCSCNSSFNPDIGPNGLFQDQLTVFSLIPGQAYSLITNNGGFYNATGDLIPENTVFTADGAGEISQIFYRGPGESADIVMSTENPGDVDVVFVSPEPCPLFDECFPTPIPTLSQWGIISLSLLLMIIGVARIKSMEQESIQDLLK